MPTNKDLPSAKERELKWPGASERPNNAIGPEGADLPGGSNEDINGARGRTAGEQAGHGPKAAEEDGQRGDADKAGIPINRPVPER